MADEKKQTPPPPPPAKEVKPIAPVQVAPFSDTGTGIQMVIGKQIPTTNKGNNGK